MANHPNSSLFNVDVTDRGERIAFVRGAVAAWAWAQGMDAPGNVGRVMTGNEKVFLSAVGDALELAGEQAATGTYTFDGLAQVEHCLVTAREAIRIAVRDSFQS